jgi:DNA repair protein RecO (recombination protein O)
MGLLCGFYINELMLKLLAREDPHEALFVDYQVALHALSTSGVSATGYAAILRRFEKRLLAELGYAQPFEFEADSGAPVDAAHPYFYVLDRGALRERPSGAHVVISVHGKTLLDLAADDYRDPTTLTQSKQLMRLIINHHLGGQTLHARELLKDLQQL